MAFDFGLRQIGVAVGNRETRTAQALTTLSARDGTPRWEEIRALLDQWKPGLLLVGLPLHMDGDESCLSQRARRFSRRLEGRFSIAVDFVDERLTSYEAKTLLAEQGRRGSYKEAPADALAAQLILETWLSAEREP
ncbi:MAG: Holliday junction resolvase RuvX [Halieaceae bacterium]|nr:Holliday junction resolvase RuvX [Halieaceae bacterium]